MGQMAVVESSLRGVARLTGRAQGAHSAPGRSIGQGVASAPAEGRDRPWIHRGYWSTANQGDQGAVVSFRLLAVVLIAVLFGFAQASPGTGGIISASDSLAR